MALPLALVLGQTPPNLSGSWKCDVEKSTWGTSNPPPDLTFKIRQQGQEMFMTQVVAGETEEFRFITDGRENVNHFSQGTLKSRMTWQGSVLAVESTLGDGEVTLSDRLTLSAGGNTLRINRRMKAPDGESDWVLILEKEAEAKPNLSGAWKVNTAKSDFGTAPAPTSMISKIDHRDPVLKISNVTVRERGERTYDLAFATDGAETSNVVDGTEFKTRCKWDGAALLMESRSGPGDRTGKDTWTLSEDGKVLTLVRIWSGPQGEITQKLVHERQ